MRLVAPAYGLGVVARRVRRRWSTTCRTGGAPRATGSSSRTVSWPVRRAIAQKYGVDGVLCETEKCVSLFTTRQSGGEVVAQGPSWKLVRLPAR